MFIDLERVPPEGEVLDRVLAESSLSVEGEEFRLIADVVLSGRVEPVEKVERDEEGLFRLRGSLSGKIEVGCVRCLEPCSMDVDEELDLLYLPQSRNVAPDVREGSTTSRLDDRSLDPEELAVGFYRDDRIDLAQMVREQILLALPMKPLCREDCLGLCPVCGANRNAQACECAPDDIDPRWESLKSLLG